MNTSYSKESKERLKQYLDRRGMPARISERLGITNAYALYFKSGEREITDDIMERVIETCPEISAWLLTGDGVPVALKKIDEDNSSEVSILKRELLNARAYIDKLEKDVDFFKSLLLSQNGRKKEAKEEASFNKGVTKNRYKNRGPIHKKDQAFIQSWPKDLPEPSA